MDTKTEHKERRKYRRYDMPREKRDAYLLWDDQSLQVECVDFSAGGCGVFFSTKIEFEVGQIVFLKSDQGKFRATIVNIAHELGGTRLGCEYIESVVSEYDMIQKHKPVKQRKFRSSSLTDPTMLVGLLVFGIFACVISTVVYNHESEEDSYKSFNTRIVTTRNLANGPKDFSTDAKRNVKKQALDRSMKGMKKRVKKLNKEQKKYLEKVRERIASVGIVFEKMGIDLSVFNQAWQSISTPDDKPESAPETDSANSKPDTSN